MDYPKKYGPDDIPDAVFQWIETIIPLLLKGDHPVLFTLRAQFQCASIKEVTLTGVGFFAEFEVPSHAPQTDPASFDGGSAYITLEGGSHGADCVLFIRDHRLALLECFTHVDDVWPVDAVILSVENVVPAFWEGRVV
jgi:hypothetical protein